MTVTSPRTYHVDNESVVGARRAGLRGPGHVNGTNNPIGSSLVTVNAAVDTVAVDPIDLAGLTAQEIASGQQLTIPFRFKVQDGPSGPLQIAVKYAEDEPVMFTDSF